MYIKRAFRKRPRPSMHNMRSHAAPRYTSLRAGDHQLGSPAQRATHARSQQIRIRVRHGKWTRGSRSSEDMGPNIIL
eukprot:3889751-Pyramimonas_sp.AAC.1